MAGRMHGSGVVHGMGVCMAGGMHSKGHGGGGGEGVMQHKWSVGPRKNVTIHCVKHFLNNVFDEFPLFSLFRKTKVRIPIFPLPW